MRRRHLDITFFFSLFCSLVINTGMVGVVVLHTQPPRVVDLSSWHARPYRTQATPPAPVEVPPAPPAAKEPADVLPPPPPPPPEKTIEFDTREAFGENGGMGKSLNSSPGDQPMQGLQAPQIQAFLGRNRPSPAGGGGGAGGQGGVPMIGAVSPTESAAPHVKVPEPPVKPAPPQPAPAVAQNNLPKTPDKPGPQQKAQPAVNTPPPPPPELAGTEPPKPPPAPAVVASAPPSAPPPPPAPTAQQDAAVRPATPAQTPPAKSGKPGAPGPPGPPDSSPDAAPQSDKESDPFSDTNSFRFVNGSVQARNGRWVKTVKPRFGDAGMLDAALVADPSVTFLATVDEQGNVINVVRYRSSGSENIDLPCEQALNQWKIEPSKDKDGHPIRDIVAVTFAMQG